MLKEIKDNDKDNGLVNRKNQILLKQKQKELERRKKRQLKQNRKAAEKLRKENEERQRSIWIDSTQMSIGLQDIIQSIVVTTDRRYLKIIEIVPQNLEMLTISKQNQIGDAFGGLLNVIPFKVQFKSFARKGDINEQLNAMRANMAESDNDIIRSMQEDYLKSARETALTVGVKRRFFLIIEHQDTASADGTGFDGIVSNLEFIASVIKSRLLECGNEILGTGDTDEGVNEIFYEILNRRKSETIPFKKHAMNVFENYETESIERELKEGVTEKGNALIAANEFVAPAWIDFNHARYFVVDGKFYSHFYIESDGYPQDTATGWMSFLINYCEGIDVDIFIERIPREKITEKISRNQKFNLNKSVETTNTDYFSTADTVRSGWYVLSGIAAGQECFHVSTLITVCADTLQDINFRSNSLEKASKANSIRLRRATFMSEAAFKSTLPLCKLDKSIKRKSWQNMLTEGAASMYPFLSFELQDPTGIMMGTNVANNSVVSLDLFDTSRHVNANVAIVGKSGQGKTFTAQLLAIRERLQGIQVFIITPLKGAEDYLKACNKIQGQFLTMGPGTQYSINILDIIPPDADVDTDKRQCKSYLAQKIQSLHTFLKLIVKDISFEEDRLMDGYFYIAYADKGITEDNDSLYIEGTSRLKEAPLLGDVFDLIKNVPELKRVANILTPYISGSHSEYNKKTNVDLTNKYIVFDMGGLDGDDLAVALFVCLDFVWMKIKENRGDKKSVYIDELWKLIGIEGNDLAAQYCVEIFKTIRAYGGSAKSMTQEVSDFFKIKNGMYGKAIISNSDTKIVLRLDNGEIDILEDVMELSEKDRDRILKYAKGQGLMLAGNARVEVNFTASKKETYVISTDPEIARQEQREKAARKLALSQLDKTDDFIK